MCLGWSRIARRCSCDYVNDVLGPWTWTNPKLGIVVPSRRSPTGHVREIVRSSTSLRACRVAAWCMVWRPSRRPGGGPRRPGSRPNELAHGQLPRAACRVLVCRTSCEEVRHAGTGNPSIDWVLLLLWAGLTPYHLVVLLGLSPEVVLSLRHWPRCVWVLDVACQRKP